MSPSAALSDLTLDELIAERLRTNERNASLRVALREWAKTALGSVDRLSVLIADRLDCTVSNARGALYQAKSDTVLAAAVEIYQEHVAAEQAVTEQAAAEHTETPSGSLTT